MNMNKPCNWIKQKMYKYKARSAHVALTLLPYHYRHSARQVTKNKYFDLYSNPWK